MKPTRTIAFLARSTRPLRRAGRRGMTIIELMVVIGIIVLVIGLGVVGFGGIRSAEVDATGGLITGAMRYVHTLAIHNNKTYRLVLDIEAKNFYVEGADSDDPCARYLPDEDADPMDGGAQGAPKGQLGESSARRLAEGSSTGRTAEGNAGQASASAGAGADRALANLAAGVAAASGQPSDRKASLAAQRGGRFARDDSALLSKEFRPETNVAGVVTEHHSRLQEEGKIAIYFYPSGRAERALVYVGGAKDDEDEDIYYAPEVTIELHALGTVTRHGGVVDERDFLRSVEDDREEQ